MFNPETLHTSVSVQGKLTAYDKQNKRVLTFRTNVFFELIRSISTALSGIKNGDSINIDQISARVTSLGPSSNFLEDIQRFLD